MTEKYENVQDDLGMMLKDPQLTVGQRIDIYKAGGLYAIANEISCLEISKSTNGQKQINQRKTIPNSVRHHVFKRDNYKCQECGKTKDDVSLEIDHINPVSKGGTDDIDNLRTLCIECNRGKGVQSF